MKQLPEGRDFAESGKFTVVFIWADRSIRVRFAKNSFGSGFLDLENRQDARAPFSGEFENQSPAVVQLDFEIGNWGQWKLGSVCKS